MTIIICADDRNGLLFNSRRLSRDSAVCDSILEICQGNPLWMNAYSASIFPRNVSNIRVSENFLEEMREGEFCFIENTDISAISVRAKNVVIYRWNRSYPADVGLPENLLYGRKRLSSVDFAGNSHLCITREVYE